MSGVLEKYAALVGPANLGAVYAGLSALLGQDAEALADSVETNFRSLFG